MRFLLTPLLVAATTTALSAEPAQYQLDPEHTAVYFTVDHIGYSKTLGIFGEVSGTFTYDMETQDLSDVRVSINADSVNSFNKARDGHVRGKDFLHVNAHPEITFVADGGTPKSASNGTVTGNLTLLGETKPVTLNVTLNKADTYPFGHGRFVLGLSIDTSIKRSAFGMDYAVANGLVGDVVDINIETEAMKMD